MGNGINLQVAQGTISKIDLSEIRDGRIYVSTDTNELLFDPIGKNKRIKISDFITVDNIDDVIAPLYNKLYFDNNSKQLIKFIKPTSEDGVSEKVIIGSNGSFVTYNEFDERNEVIATSLNDLHTNKADKKDIVDSSVVLETEDNKTYTLKQGGVVIGTFTTGGGDGKVKSVNTLEGDVVLYATNIAMSDTNTKTISEVIGDISTILDEINGVNG